MCERVKEDSEVVNAEGGVMKCTTQKLNLELPALFTKWSISSTFIT